MRLSTAFNVLTSMKFFKHYLDYKIFRLWRHNVRFKLYCQQRAKLQSKLFLAKPTFCEPVGGYRNLRNVWNWRERGYHIVMCLVGEHRYCFCFAIRS